jgi:hypothetical protein
MGREESVTPQSVSLIGWQWRTCGAEERSGCNSTKLPLLPSPFLFQEKETRPAKETLIRSLAECPIKKAAAVLSLLVVVQSLS